MSQSVATFIAGSVSGFICYWIGYGKGKKEGIRVGANQVLAKLKERFPR